MLSRLNPFHSPITFSITAEDHKTVEQAFGSVSRASVLCIGSAGDTPLNLLRLDPKRIDVVDVKFAQLCEAILKAEAMRQLSLPEFHTLIGVIRSPKLALECYVRVRSHLPANVRLFWDSHEYIIRRGVLWQGGVQKMFSLIRRAVWLMIGGDGINQLKTVSTRQQAEAFYDRYLRSGRFQFLFRLIANRTTYRAFYPKIGFQHLPSGMSPHQFSLQKVRDILLRQPIADNPYIFPFVFGFYSSIQGMPPYLNPMHYDAIASRIERLKFINLDLADYLASAPEDSVDLFALCNVMDWMDEMELTQLLNHVVRVSTSKARILILSRSKALTVPESLRANLRLEPELSKTLASQDRVGYYTFANALQVTK